MTATQSSHLTAATDSAPALLSIEDVEYSYPNGLQALGGLSVQLRPGEILSIVGPSGSGKSTLLSLIAGITEPSGGVIRWAEGTSTAHDSTRRQLAMVFQRDTVFPWRTVEKNISFGLDTLSLTKDERQRRVVELLELVNLEQFRKAYPRSLSGGMRRKVALLMGLAVRPSLLLLDEPFAALDEPTRVELLADVLKLTYEYGVSVILVTHDLGEAISVSDRVVVLSNRPATVRKVYRVPFGHDRDIYALRETPEYAELYTALWHELWSSIGKNKADPRRSKPNGEVS